MRLWHQVECHGKRQRLNDFNVASLWLLLVSQTPTHERREGGTSLQEVFSWIGSIPAQSLWHWNSNYWNFFWEKRRPLRQDCGTSHGPSKKPSPARWSLATCWEGEQGCPHTVQGRTVLDTLCAAGYHTWVRMPPRAQHNTSCPALCPATGASTWASHWAPPWWALWERQVVWHNERSIWNICPQLLSAGREGDSLWSTDWVCREVR